MIHALRMVGIGKSFDGFAALTEATFECRWGEMHAVLGENGAGKSSLMNIAAGLYAPETGTLRIDENLARLDGPRDASRHRIGMVHQHFKLVRPFTVAQNVLLGLPPAPDAGAYRKRLRGLEQAIAAKAAELGFDIDPRQRVEALSIAEQQRVEILKVLMAGARILILDEPTAVLTDQEAERLLSTVHRLSRQGAAVVLVTHKMADVRKYCDRVTVMRGGRTIATVDPRATPVAELIRLTVGDGALAAARASGGARAAEGASTAPRLRVRGLSGGGQGGVHGGGGRRLDGVDFDVRAGEIYGLAGVGGNGQSELAGALIGLPNELDGQILLEGAGDLLRLDTSQRRALGIATIPADRYRHALGGSLSIADNFGIGQVHAGRYGGVGWLRRRALERDAAAAVAAFDVQGVRSVRQNAALLSGGNAQKLVIAREFSKTIRFVLAHSPSRGLDVRAGAEVHARLAAARDAGAAVLLISEDLDEVLALSDRIGVMARGRIVAEFSAAAGEAFDRQAIGQAMVDHD